MNNATVLPSHLQNEVTLFNEKKEIYEKAKKTVVDKENSIQLIEQRKKELIKTTEKYDELWRKAFHENNGELTDEMKQMRTESLLSKETVIEFDKLIQTQEKELKSLNHQLGLQAKSLIHQRNRLSYVYMHYLLDSFLETHGKELNRIMQFCYLVLNEGDFESLIKDKVMKNWRQQITASDASLLSPKIDYHLSHDVYYDQNKALSPWQLSRQKDIDN
ncbi:hypothetical protein ACSNKO_18320 [Proteus mirabilis]|uniref:hypothetical protein n=1 Tax=Proteus mirabilis TaxID=584 RepID=UPI003F1ACB39